MQPLLNDNLKVLGENQVLTFLEQELGCNSKHFPDGSMVVVVDVIMCLQGN